MAKRIHIPDGMHKITKNMIEKMAWDQQETVCGIDEVGRGCLAGPLVTAAVILPINKKHPLLQDSKLLTAEERLTAYRWITRHAAIGIGIIHHRYIDTHNIWQSTLHGMKRATMQLFAQRISLPMAIIVDAMPLELNVPAYQDIAIYYFPKGERYSSSIAAASIVAKVYRDQLMDYLNPLFPAYSFNQHKGYGTKQHYHAIQTKEHSLIHRTSFLTEGIYDREESPLEQQRIC